MCISDTLRKLASPFLYSPNMSVLFVISIVLFFSLVIFIPSDGKYAANFNTGVIFLRTAFVSTYCIIFFRSFIKFVNNTYPNSGNLAYLGVGLLVLIMLFLLYFLLSIILKHFGLPGAETYYFGTEILVSLFITFLAFEKKET